MPQNTNLNVSPYFDDFVDSKNYQKVLFKPGFPVQARELTTLQTILQNQVEKFGQHFFKEGAMVIPGGTSYDDEYNAVKIDPNFLNIPVFNYTKIVADARIKIQGETSGVEATVVNRLTSAESIDGFDTLYVKYTKSGTDGETKVFLDGENLITLSSFNYLNTSITANSQFARCIVSDATSTGCAFSVSEGVYFIRGFFVKNVASTAILDQYTNEPSYRVGFLINEETVRASSVNSDLYDNAKGFSNESAPGADRFKLSISLHKKLLSDSNDDDFVELLRVENGEIKEIVTKTEYNIFADELARRTYDESGDYYVRPFTVNAKESLNNRIGNKGVYFDTQQTQNGNIPSDNLISLQISSGKAFVRGYEVENIGTSSIDILKPRTTKLVENQSVPIRMGKSVSISQVFGSPDVGFQNNTISGQVQLLRNRLTVDKAAAPGAFDADERVGTAKVYDFKQTSATGIAVTTYNLSIYDVQLYTRLTLSKNIDVDYGAYTRVEGKNSGAVGYSAFTITNTSLIVLTDVTGEFQLNEPLIINGITEGNSVTAIEDNTFEDVKAVHSSGGLGSGSTTFAANTVLNSKKQIFQTGAEFEILELSDGTSGFSTVRGSSVTDFRTLVKVGDIISYTGGANIGNNIPTFNRVKDIGIAGTSFLIENVADVSGTCNGGVAASSPTDIIVRVPTLNESDDPGFRVKLADDYISSINVLDSSYVMREQITKTFSNNSVQFNITEISTAGDTTNLFFEPFSADNYILEMFDSTPNTRVVEKLLPTMVSVDIGLKQVTISGLSGPATNRTAKLTVAVRRSKLVSKEKSLTRCSSLVIDRSESVGSGTTIDGLTTSTIYGTRVQDKELSLDVPEVTRILGIFEANDVVSDPPSLPLVTVNNQSSTFTNNVVVGEQFIGSLSGAVARVVIVQATQLSFVYENENTFEIGETISLKTSGIIATVTGVAPGDRNVLKNYDLDNGQRIEFCDYSRLIRKSDVEKPSRKLRVIFDHLSNNEVSGNVETVNSYNTLNYTNDIPFVFDSWASDYLDFRPRVGTYNRSSSTISPFVNASRDFSSSQSDSVISGKTVIVDYSYYQGRIDRLYLTKDGAFVMKDGTPSRTPKSPVPNEEGFQVATIKLPPYIRNAENEILIKRVPHKRYTMRDIGSLESRIKNLENYTTLSLLETDTKNLAVKDPNTGLDKFKSGFFVDNFRNHNSHNLTGESNFDIDIENSECRPRSTERNVALVFETTSTTASPESSDYKFASDFPDSNVTRGGAALTLNYSETPFIVQPNATRVENLNPFMVDVFVGSIELTPNSDFWIHEAPIPPQNVEIDNVYDAMSQLLGVEDRENGGMASSFWNSHETTWNGRDSATLIDESITGRQVLSSRSRTNTQTTGNTITGGNIRTTTTTTRDIRNTIEQTFRESGTQKEFGLELSSSETVVDLGTKVLGIDVLYTVRSRNVEVFAKRLKPNTKFYVFMENQDLTKYAVPKYLPITMTRGSFSVNEEVETVESAGSGIPNIRCRVANPNHKIGPYNDPNEIVTILPVANDSDPIAVPQTYSSTSQILNIDTADLALQNNPNHFGYVKKGQSIVNSSGTAEATIGDISLMSDSDGDLIFSLHIPDPTESGNPTFTTGSNTIKVTTSETNASILDPGSSSAEEEYFSSGYQTNTQEQTLSIKAPVIERVEIGSVDVSRTFTDTRTEDVTETTTNVQNQAIPRRRRNSSPARRRRRRRARTGRRGDPLAQSFLVDEAVYESGIFITSGELFFKTKDDEIPVTIQIRTMRDGIPTQEIVPFGETKIKPEDINLSEDGSAVTTFKFETPVFLQSGHEYAIVLMAFFTEKYLAFINRMGESDLITQGLNTTQPVLGSLFKSQNNTTWSPSQYEDLKFTLNQAQFITNTPSSVLLYNSELPLGKIMKNNPVVAFSKRVNVKLGIATEMTLTPGDEIQQTVSAVVNTGRIFKTGGPIKTGTSKLTIVSNTGIGLTTGTFTGIGFTSLTGDGQGLEAQVVVAGNPPEVTAGNVTITTQGSGYAPGDLLLMNPVGATGSGVRAIVTSHVSIGGTDLIVLDEVKNDFVPTANMVHFTQGGAQTTFPDGEITSVTPDSIRDGYTLKFDHKNHGMHSNTNDVKIVNFHPDGSPTTLTQKLDDDSTQITVTSGSSFETFEGKTVNASFPGYVLIDKEIIEYKGVSGNNLTTISRGIDQSLKSNHAGNSLVFKYEFNGISLRKINKVDIDEEPYHNIDSREKTFDSYFVKVSTASTNPTFNATKSGGGNGLQVSQNIPFEAIDPQITSITPTGTNITARIKTTSGTSLSGNEASFTDKGYENIALNKLNYLDDPRIIASNINEYNILGNQKSFALELTLTTDNVDVSPVIDLQNPNIIAISNLVDDKVDNFETDSRPKIPGFDPNSAIYETKMIDLEFISNSLLVQFDGHREAEGDIRVFYKLIRSDGDDRNATYIPFNTNGLPDKVVNPNTTRNGFSEYKYTAENTPQFNGFMLKVVMTSINQAKPPRIKNFRGIALRSFEIE